MTSRLDEKETDSYLQTMEANTLANPEADVQDKPPSQDDKSMNHPGCPRTQWQERGSQVRGGRDALLQSCASLV